MITEIIKGNIEALEPIHHGGNESYGTSKMILKMPQICINPDTGEEEILEIPCIHGNAIRGYLRRLIMQDFLDLLGYKLNSKKLYHFLFTGGILESLDKKDKGAINLSLKQKIRSNIIPISLLGSALGNQMFEGKLKVGIANIVCSETKHYIDEDIEGFSAYALQSSDFGTRLDDLKIEEKTVEDEQNKDEQKTQMIYEFETLIRGTTFTHEFVLEDMDSVECSCFARMISLWEERPYIGGMRGTGYGKIKINYPYIDSRVDEEYLNYIENHKEEIMGLLKELEKVWK